MSVILDELNNRYDNKYKYLRINKVDVDTKNGSADVIYIYPYEKEEEFTEEEREEIRQWTEHMLPEKLKYNILFKKSYVDEEVLIRKVKEFFKEKMPIIGSQLSSGDIKVSLEEDSLNVNIDVSPRFYDYVIIEEKIEETLGNYLNHSFTRPAKVSVTKKDKDDEFVFTKGEESVVEFRQRVIDAREKERGYIIGKGIASRPMFIGDIKNPSTDITVCGKIEMFTRRIAKSGNIFYTFTLNDTTGRISCKYFTRCQDKGALDGMQDGTEVLIIGNVENDMYTKDLSVLIRRLSLCTINYDSIEQEKEMNILHDTYLTIEPQKYTETHQESMFSDGSDYNTPVRYLTGRDFVVFDFETTGLDTSTDTPIELAAVKVRDGKIIETFSTFVNPLRPIPEKITEITSINDDMVKDAPEWKDIVADFYKFTRNSALVAHNISYDYSILQNRSKEFGYSFDNELLDTCRMSGQYIHASNNKLETVCKYVGIVLDGAHRAINDTIATAKLFIYIAKNFL